MAEPCPVCETISEARSASVGGNHVFHFVCPRCGEYRIEYVAKDYLKVQLDPSKVAVLSHAIRKMQRNNQVPLFDQRTIAFILQNPLPTPAQQLNTFVLWLGNNIPGLGEMIHINAPVIQAEIGARTQDGVEAIIDHLVEKNFLVQTKLGTEKGEPYECDATLKLAGWEYYDNLKRGSISSRKAFMAMQYGDKELDELVEKYFRSAVKAAGFDLFRLDDMPKAGLIDDRLSVEIRTSRFLIADLTHENRGAYWEAGFAQGLGKPVIYTCEKSKFDEQKTHFDTNHHTTIVWDRNDLEKAADQLKNTIRETLPDDAKLIDDN